MFDSVRAARGVIRSLRIYYGDRRRRGALDRHYAGFAGAGDLVFDIGGHVGDRVASFRRLGARVVAVEPQPALAATLRLFYGRNPAVTIEQPVGWVGPVGWIERGSPRRTAPRRPRRETHQSERMAMGFAAQSDMRPILPLNPSYAVARRRGYAMPGFGLRKRRATQFTCSVCGTSLSVMLSWIDRAGLSERFWLRCTVPRGT
jgi:hypothetical protein